MALSNFGRNIKTLRDLNSITQQEFADALGVTQNTVSGWETRNKKPRQPDIITKICDIYDLSERDLFGFGDGLYAKTYKLSNIVEAAPIDSYAPVMGNISAGDPREAIEYTDKKIWVPPDLLERDKECFYLRVSGDSMNLTDYQDGVYALISPNTEVHNGDIAAVKVNGDDATIKRYKFYDNAIILEPQSSNPTHRRRIIDESDPDAPYVRILGKAVWAYKPPTW